MKKSLLSAALSLLISVSAFAQVSFGDAQLFNSGWRFHLGDVPEAAEATFNDSGWTQVSLPHDWSVEQPISPNYASGTGFLPGGIGWYRKTFFGRTITAEQAFIYFEGVYNRSTVYLNGHKLGERPNGYISFMYDMTPYLNKEGMNVLAVRVDHTKYADSRFYTGSGIYRDVWLVGAGKTHFAQWGVGYVASNVTAAQATVTVDAAIEGIEGVKGNLVLNLKDASGNVVAKASVKAASSQNVALKVKNPHIWDLKDPYLYTLEASIQSGKKTLDATTVKVGIRTLQFDPNKGFALNGNWMKVKGVCIHHDAGVLGAAVPEPVIRHRLEVLKQYGANAIRTAHNPQTPYFYDICDEIGLLVMDEAYDEWEFPKKKWVEGWNRGTPSMDGTDDFFNEWSDRDVTDMVKRDRNHPCVMMWSIGNEVDYPNDPYSHPILDGGNFEFNQPMSGGYKPDAPQAERIGIIAKRLAADVKAVDTSRPVTGALAGVVMSNQTEYPQAVDVVGYNYTESRYGKDHDLYPERVIYGSETSGGYSAWKSVLDNDHIFGQFIWTGADFLGEAGAWPSRGSTAGIIDMANFPKPNAYARASWWVEEPVCFLGTGMTGYEVWNYNPGEKVRVTCYTNAAKARLILNGKQVGETLPFDAQRGSISWNAIPFEEGTLKAEALDESGKVVATSEIKTTGMPYALKVTADKADISKAGSVSIVTIEVVDKDGQRVVLADNEISCMVQGPARFLGLESGNSRDINIYTANVRRANHGRLVAYVQGNGMPGNTTLSFSSPMLKNASITLESHRYTKLEDIQLSDPFIMADEATGKYYMTGTGGSLWISDDLKTWDGPLTVAQTSPRSWMGQRPMIWAAELHKYNGKYYYFATFTNQAVSFTDPDNGSKQPRRACHILVSDRPEGPYTPVPMSDPTYLPENNVTLDASLWVENGQPYLMFCHEWVQTQNGTVEAIPLKPGFTGTVAEGRKLLFRAFDSPWSREKGDDGKIGPNKVTDGPYVFKTKTGRLGMIWTSWVYSDYTQGVAYSTSGKIEGPWIQQEEPITPPNYGHGMIFTTLDGRRILCCHSHESVNGRTVRRPVLFNFDDTTDNAKINGIYLPAK